MPTMREAIARDIERCKSGIDERRPTVILSSAIEAGTGLILHSDPPLYIIHPDDRDRIQEACPRAHFIPEPDGATNDGLQLAATS